MGVRIRYFAAAKAALGRASDERAAGTTIAELLGELAAEAATVGGGSGVGSESGERIGATSDATTIERILARCTFIHNRTATDDRTIVLADGDTLDVLPPFAGG